jgi:cytoskeletal protein CcmA (bactofilin family)
MKKLFFSFLLTAGVLAYAAPGQAAMFLGGEAISLPHTEPVAEDVYAFGANLMLAGDIEGDLTAAGANVLVKGNVSQDLNAAGGTVDALGNVGDDLRIAGGKVAIHGEVGGDLLVAGGMVQLLPGAVVRGDVRAVGGMVVLDGDVEGDVNLAGGTVVLNGLVLGEAEVTAEEQVLFGKLAKFSRSVTYSSPFAGDEKTGAVFEQGVRYTELKLAKAPQFFWQRPDWTQVVAAGLAWFLIRSLAMLLAALLALKYFRPLLEDVAAKTKDNFGGRLIWGFGFMVVVPVLIIALFMTLIGSVLGGLLLALYSLALVLAKIAVGPFIAGLFLRVFKGQKKHALDWKWLTWGVLAYQLAWVIPVIGWAFGAVVFVAVFGTVILEAKPRLKA